MSGMSRCGGTRRAQTRAGNSSAILGVVVLVLAAALVPASSGRPHTAEASVMAADAADYVPSATSLPGFREESADAVGGDLDPTIAQQRSFISPDGNRRVIVTVSVGSSIANAQSMLDD